MAKLGKVSTSTVANNKDAIQVLFDSLYYLLSLFNSKSWIGVKLELEETLKNQTKTKTIERLNESQELIKSFL